MDRNDRNDVIPGGQKERENESMRREGIPDLGTWAAEGMLSSHGAFN